MKELNEEKFSIFIPFELEKSSDGEDKYKNMRIKGIASTTSKGEDADGETLEPSGMDLTELTNGGSLNWHHLWTKDPLAIIGEPTKAEIRNNELYLEGKLYSNSKKAREVYDLAEILEKDSDTRRLGWSIEGKALVRDKKDPKKILKSKISGVAITPSPKCKGTRMDIMKGSFADVDFELVKGHIDTDNEYLVDVIDESGVRRTVDKDFEIRVWSDEDLQKAMQAGSITGRDTTNQVLGQESLKQESIDGVKKKKKKKAVKDDGTKIFSKGEMYNTIFSIFKISDINDVKNLYSLIEDIQKGLTPNMADGITSDAIEKAKNLLKATSEKSVEQPIVKTIEQPELVKAAENTDLKKGFDKLKNDLDTIKKAIDEFSLSLTAMINSDKPNGTDATPAATEKLTASDATLALAKKGEDADLVKSQVDELTKGLTEQISTLTNEIKNKETENSDLKKSFDELSGKVDKLLKSNPGPKSITAVPVERFAAKKDGEVVLSLASNKRRIVDELVKAAGDDFNETNIFAQAASCVEISGALGGTAREASAVAQALRTKTGIIIQG